MTTKILNVLIPPDQFKGTTDKASKNEQGAGQLGVRRPTNGIVLKDDTFATIQVLKGDGSSITSLYDAGSRRKDAKQQVLEYNGKRTTDIYSNFFLQSISESREEKQQIMETFGESYIFFFGQRARVMQFQGVLVNTWDFNWEAEWWANYDEFLRGTKCVENNARLYIQFDNTLVGGYIINSQSQKIAEQRNTVQFSFSLFVTDYIQLENPAFGDPKAQQAFSGLKSGDTKTISKAEIDAARPTLLESGFTNPNVTLTQDPDGTWRAASTGLTTPTTKSGLAALTDAWKQSVASVNRFFDTVNQVTNGTVVRVPHGYAGSLAYDEGALETLKPVVSQDTIISFSTFAENEEEYVNSGNHYSAPKRTEVATMFAENASYDASYIRLREFMASKGEVDLPEDFASFDGTARSTDGSSALVTLSMAAQSVRLGLIAWNLGQSIASFKRPKAAPDSTAPWSSRRYSQMDSE
jgi:hypothetical protein